MAFVRKRASDKARGKAGKYTCYWDDENGKQRSKVGTTDKAQSQAIADKLEAEATLIRNGVIDLGERARRSASLRPMADHLADYRKALTDKGGTAKHATRTANALAKLFVLASVPSVADLSFSRISAALAGLKMKNGKAASARTRNFHLAAAKSFAVWLKRDNRIGVLPDGLMSLLPSNQKEDRRRVRRPLTKDELACLLEMTEAGDPVTAKRGPRAEGYVRADVETITGAERAIIYRLAVGTGFRADEIRTLTPERFHLDGHEPTVTVLACYAKNGKEAVQPISRDLAERLRPFIEGKEAGKPFLPVPRRTAEMLQSDLTVAGIKAVDAKGRVVDFHSLRATFISHLVARGINPKTVQKLARHSTIVLTMDIYASDEDGDARKALEGDE